MLFLFDYDGVIADSFESLLGVCVEAQMILREGRPPTPEDFQKIQNLTFDELGRTIGIPEDKCVAYARNVFEIQQKGWQVSPFPEVLDVVKKLATEHTVAVVTNSQDDAVTAALCRFGIGAAVTTVMGSDSGTTKVDRIQRLKEAHMSEAEPVYMIGDTIGDIRAGKQAGVRTVAVTWGFQKRDLLLKEAPDYLLDAPHELFSLAGSTDPN